MSGTTDADERAAIAERARISELSDQLHETVRARSVTYWQDRMVSTTVHSEFLAVSWSGDREYRLAQAYEKASRRFRKRRDPDTGFGWGADRTERDRTKLVHDLRERYAFKQNRRYAEECYVFYKSSEIAPVTLTSIAPTLLPAFYAAPLHHFFVIRRHQPVAERDDSVAYTAWTVAEPPARTAQDMIKQITDSMFPKKCPDSDVRGGGDIPWGLIVATGFLILVLMATAAWWFWGEGRDQFERLVALSDPSPPASPTTQMPVLTTDSPVLPASTDGRFGQVEAQLASIEARLVDLVTHDQIATHQAEIRGLLGEMQDAQAQGAGDVDTGGLDLPACLPVRQVGGHRVPTYLFVAVFSARGITAIAPGNDDAQAASIRNQLPYIGQTVDADRFVAESRTLFAQSQGQGCRHYVMLLDNEAGEVSSYIAQRQAVEDHFYIYRIRQ